jgi:hypothetical protein
MYQGAPVAMRRPWFVALPDYRHPARNILWLSAHWRASDGTDVLLLSTDTALDLQRRDGRISIHWRLLISEQYEQLGRGNKSYMVVN